MSMRRRNFVLGLVSLTAMATALLFYRPQGATAGGRVDGGWAIYNNDQAFEMLSGSARSVLEAKFGRKTVAHTFTDLRTIEPSTFASAGGPLPPNVIVNNRAEDTGSNDTQSETSTVLLGQNVIVGFNDSEEFDGLNPHFTGWANSINLGGSFSDHGPLPVGTTGVGDAGDPSLAVNTSSKVIYFATLGFNVNYTTEIFKSTDNGKTFAWSTDGTPVHIGSSDFIDKEWLAVDNNAGTGQGNIYQVFRNFAGGTNAGYIGFNRSTDGGATFVGELSIAAAGSFNVQGANVLVGNDHSVYVFWLDQSAGAGTNNKIMVRKSTDNGATFGSAVTVATLNTTGINGDLGLNGGFRSNAFVQSAVNPVNGDLYIVDNDFNGSFGPDILMWRSHDGGATWSGPTRVNDDSTSRDQFMPGIAVSPDGTRIGISWYDRRSDPNNSLIERWAVTGVVNTDSSITFRPNFKISSGNWPVIIGQDPDINSTYMGDYDKASSGVDTNNNNFFFYSWGDNRLKDAAHLHQPDVREARVSCCIADLALTNSGPSSVASGSNITYTITYNNSAGPDTATTIAMTDVVPSGTTFVSVTTSAGTCTHPIVGATGTVKCSLSSLLKGGPTVTITMVVKVTAPSGSVIKDTAKLSEAPYDPTPDSKLVTTNIT